MAKLYPPILQGVLPAFSTSEKIKIPFTMNRSVSRSQVSGFSLSLKEAETGKVWMTNKETTNIDWTNNTVTFSIPRVNGKSKFFKAQLAYINNQEEVGYYSTLGLIKYSQAPTLTIGNLSLSENNKAQKEYVGDWKTEDSAEVPYQYRFIVNNSIRKEVYNTGWLLYLGNDGLKIKPPNFMEDNQVYFIRLEVQTINGLIAVSPSYQIYKQYDAAIEFKGKVQAVSNEEDGYVELSIIPRNEGDKIEDFEGAFLILRASADTNYSVWEEVYSTVFEKPGETLGDGKIVYKDFLAVPGMSYKYGIKKYNNQGIFTLTQESNPVLVKYDHIYLYDGERQLKFNFNPQISSVKRNILETKHNTLGRKYPIFMRSGILNFKEFQLTALISYLSDNDFQFVENKELMKYVDESELINTTWGPLFNEKGEEIVKEYYKNNNKIYHHLLKEQRTYPKNTNSTYSNFAVEKKYREEVENFLTNGKPKFYKSTTEGGLIIKTSEVSFSPNQQLGRMIGDFSCTITEIAECNQKNLEQFNLAIPFVPITREQFHIFSWELFWDGGKYSYNNGNEEFNFMTTNMLDCIWEPTTSNSYGLSKIQISASRVVSLQITGAPAGMGFILDGEEIKIGITGELNLNNINISSLKLGSLPKNTFIERPIYITVSYYTDQFIDGDEFNEIYESNYYFNLTKQQFGPCDLFHDYSNTARNSLIRMGNIQLIKRDIVDYDESITTLDYDKIYRYVDADDNVKYKVQSLGYNNLEKIQDYFLEGENGNPPFSLKFKGQEIYIPEDRLTYEILGDIDLSDIENTSFEIGPGWMVTYFESWNEKKKLSDPKFELTMPQFEGNFNKWAEKYKEYIIEYKNTFPILSKEVNE